MSDVLQQLHSEHKGIAKLLDLLEAQVEEFAIGETPDYVMMLDIMQYMTHYPDLFHHPREDILFNKMLQRESSAREMVEDLIEEHKVLAEKGAKLLETLRSIIGGFELRRDSVESKARDYLATLRNHMNKEEGQVLPMAKQILNDEDWSDVNAASDLREDPLFGKTVRDEYRALYDQIIQEGG